MRLTSFATRLQALFLPKPGSPIVHLVLPTGSRASMSKVATVSNARWRCSSQAGTTISPFASDRTLASRQCFGWRLTLWPLGRIERAVSLVRDAQARLAELTHVQTRMFGKLHAALFAMMRGDISQTDSNASELAHLAREKGLDFFSPQRVVLDGWVKAQCGMPAEGLEDMRRGIELLREQNVQTFDGLFKARLAEGEARAGDCSRAFVTLEGALATSARLGHRTFEAELHRVGGEILLRCNPAETGVRRTSSGEGHRCRA